MYIFALALILIATAAAFLGFTDIGAPIAQGFAFIASAAGAAVLAMAMWRGPTTTVTVR